MKQHGRKSTAALAAQMGKPSVIAGGFSSAKAEPPEGMTKRQVEIWRETVKCEPAQLFSTGATRSMLQEYCRLRSRADEMSDLLDAFDPAWLGEAKGQRRYEWLSRMHRMESKAAIEMATKLRLTNQSRWQPQTSTIAGEKVTDDAEAENNASIWGAGSRA
jgi:hypothetical protein